MQPVDGALVIYDVMSEDSFDRLRTVLSECHSARHPSTFPSGKS